MEHPAPHPRRRVLARLHTDESGSSAVETVLLTAFIVLPLLALPPLVMDANATVFDRVAPWTNLPFP